MTSDDNVPPTSILPGMTGTTAWGAAPAPHDSHPRIVGTELAARPGEGRRRGHLPVAGVSDHAMAARTVNRRRRGTKVAEGQRLAQLVFQSSTWIHRRVERLEMESDGDCTRKLSVDFTLPAELAVEGSTGSVLVPLSVVRKGPLRQFSVTGPTGDPVPVLETRRNGQLAVELLLATAANLFGSEFATSARDAFSGAVFAKEQEATAAVERVRGLLGDEAQIIGGAAFIGLIRQLSVHFLLIVELDAAVLGRRSIVKYSYREPLPDLKLDDARPTITWKLPEFGSAASVHFEFEPHPLLFISKMTFVQFTSDAGGNERQDTLINSLDRPTGHVAATPAHRFASAEVTIELSPHSRGAVDASAGGSAVIAVILWLIVIMRTARDFLFGPGVPIGSAAGTLLLATAGVLLSWLARTPEDWAVAQVLAGPRRRLVVSAGLILSAAALLGLPLLEPYRTWVWLLLVSAASVVALRSWLFWRRCRTKSLPSVLPTHPGGPL